MAYSIVMPTRSVMGKNALETGAEELAKLGNRALIVTGKHVAASGITSKLCEILENLSVQYSVFDGVSGEPTDQMINSGLETFRQNDCDFLIGIGGGSPLDSAKAIAVMSVLDGKISDQMGKEICCDRPPLALIPTTAGTGSEATKFTVITNTETNVKMLLKGTAMIPDLAIVDPALTISSPPEVTASTGMDALTHAVESYTSRKSNEFTDVLALSAIKRIFKNLPQAFSNGGCVEARTQMSTAAYEAGICINNASVTLVHGMSRPIGALFHVPHGISNAMLLVECMTFALDGCTQRFADMARAMGAASASCDTRASAEAFIEELRTLRQVCGIPGLRDCGIDKNEFLKLIPKMAQDAVNSGSPANTIRNVTVGDISAIYESLWA